MNQRAFIHGVSTMEARLPMKNAVSHIAALCGWPLLAAVSVAQYPGTPYGGQYGFGANQYGLNQYTRPPVVSPFLNLNRGGDPAINYYGLVRPQIAVNRALQRFGSDINYLENSPAANPEILETGHPSFFGSQYPYFANQSVYFVNNATGGRLPGAAGARPAATQAGGGQRPPTPQR
jgi:hypothetical protein